MVSTSPTSEALEQLGPMVYREVYAIVGAESAAIAALRRLMDRGETEGNIIAWFGDEHVQAHVTRLLEKMR